MSRHQWYQLVSICRVFIGTSWFQYVAPSSVPAGFNYYVYMVSFALVVTMYG